MTSTRIPGNEPDQGNMSTEPRQATETDMPENHDLPDTDAEQLGNFA